MWHMNVFRILADLSHTLSKCILIWAIQVNKSAEGVSLITQVLYAGVFCTRYWDLFSADPGSSHFSLWNFCLKIFYLSTSFYIIFLMMKLYPRTREQERSWRLGAYCLAFAVVGGPVIAAVARRKHLTLFSVSWTFSIILESVCVIPQLLLLRQTTVPTVIDSGYIVALGSYRALYILNWILRFANKKEVNPDATAVTFGIIQTALYIDFAWVYFTRQRVKLRNGGIVDSEDLTRGFLVGKILGRVDNSTREDVQDVEEDAARTPARNSRWGKRGISVSADDGILEEATSPTVGVMSAGRVSEPSNSTSKFKDGDDDDDDDDDEEVHTASAQASQQAQALLQDHDHWSGESENPR